MTSILKSCLTILFFLSPQPDFATEPSRPQLVIGIFDSLVLSTNPDEARKPLEQLLKHVGVKIGIQIHLKVLPSGSRRSLETVGREISNKKLHVVVMTSVEYGWLRQIGGNKYDVLVSTNPGANVVQREQLLVRKDDFRTLSEFSDAVFADRKRMLPTQLVYRRLLENQQESGFLAKSTKQYSSLGGSLEAVINRQADATIVDVYNFRLYHRLYTSKANKLKAIDSSRPYPMPPAVGIRTVVDGIRKDLWSELQETLVTVNNDRQASAFREVWGVDYFEKTTDKYDDECVEATKGFPLELLQAPVHHSK